MRFPRCAGGTGATGRELVAQLLGREGTWARVTTLGRRRVEDLPPGAPVSLAQAERDGRLVQKARCRHAALCCYHSHSLSLSFSYAYAL